MILPLLMVLVPFHFFIWSTILYRFGHGGTLLATVYSRPTGRNGTSNRQENRPHIDNNRVPSAHYSQKPTFVKVGKGGNVNFLLDFFSLICRKR
jgi:hypothetical protein